VGTKTVAHEDSLVSKHNCPAMCHSWNMCSGHSSETHCAWQRSIQSVFRHTHAYVCCTFCGYHTTKQKICWMFLTP